MHVFTVPRSRAMSDPVENRPIRAGTANSVPFHNLQKLSDTRLVDGWNWLGRRRIATWDHDSAAFVGFSPSSRGTHWLPSRLIPHCHRARAELHSAHKSQVDMLRQRFGDYAMRRLKTSSRQLIGVGVKSAGYWAG